MKTAVRKGFPHAIGCTAFLVLLCWPHPAPADIYQYVDSRGTIHFTNVPTNTSFKLFRQEKNSLAMVETTRYDGLIKEIARRYDVHPALVKAVIKAESAFDPKAVSKKGAQGLMQLMPETVYDLKVYDPFHPRDNINGGVKFLKQLMTRFNNDLSLALAAYNAGPEVVARYEDIPPYEETQHYVRKVLRYYDRYRREL